MNISKLIERGETAKVDFKREWYWNDNTPDNTRKLRYGEFVKDIFALTNGDKYSIDDTAYLVIGIDDTTREVCDFDFPKDHESNIKNEEKLKQDLLNKLKTYSSSEFIALDVNYYIFKEKQIIVISVPPRHELIALSKDLKYTRKGKIQTIPKETVYYRIGDAIHIATENIKRDFIKEYSLSLVQKHSSKGEDFIMLYFSDDYEKALENPRIYQNLKFRLEQKNQTLEFLLKEKKELEEKVKSLNLDSDIENKVELAIEELRFDDVIDILDVYLKNMDVTNKDIYKAHYLKSIIYLQLFEYPLAKNEIEFIPYKKLTDFGILNDYAQIYRLNEMYSSTFEIYDFILSSLRDYLKTHPYLLAMVYNNIAELHEIIGEFSDVEKYYRMALKILEEFRLENNDEKINDSMASVCNNLGTLLGYPPRYDEAEQYLQKSLDIRYELYGDINVHTIESYSNLAALYDKQDDYDNAEELYLKSLELALEVLGEQHPQTAILYNNIAEFYRNKGNYNFEEVEEFYNKSFKIRRGLYGEFHSSIAEIYNNKGELYRENGESEKAIEFYKKALIIYEGIFESDKHYMFATIYNNMGLAYSNLKRYILSIKYLNMSLDIRIDTHMENDFEVGSSHYNLYAVYFEIQNEKNAYFHIKRTVDIWENIFDVRNFYLVEAKRRLDYFER